MTLYRKELEEKARAFVKILNDFDIKASFDENSFRDYLAIIKSDYKGKGILKANLNIYYKPSRKSFSLAKKIKDDEFEKAVLAAWDKLNGFESHSAESGIYEAFVDGSYFNGITGYGAAIYLGDIVKTKLSGTVENTQSHQIGGELKAVMETLKWCDENNVGEIRINYDYIGIEKFAAGVWTAKNEIVKEYVKTVLMSKVKIQWRHIKSHSGNTKNNLADSLAKAAIESAKKQIQ
ncbi:MAG: hypothetical protein LBV16_03925 [Elusimicrobiota bacterium]|nr:hypothetical protein [Elusimicrobiota bacterium]